MLQWSLAQKTSTGFAPATVAPIASAVDQSVALALAAAHAADLFQAQAGNTVPFLSWAALRLATGRKTGQRFSVLSADTGSHTDPALGTSVPNAGVFEQQAGYADPVRIADLDSQKAAATAAALAATYGTQASLIYRAAGGAIIPGYPNLIPQEMTVAADGRVIDLLTVDGLRYESRPDGTIVPVPHLSDLTETWAPAGIYIPGVTATVVSATIRPDGRVERYKTNAGDEYVFGASGMAAKVQTADDVVVSNLATGAMVPGIGAVAAVDMVGGQASSAVRTDGRPYWFNRFGEPVTVDDFNSQVFDVVVYGSCLGGLMACARAALRGKRVCVIEPYSFFGGMHANGMTYVDTPDNANSPTTTIYGGLTFSVYFNRVAEIVGVANRFVAGSKTYETVALRILAETAARTIRNAPIGGPRDVLMTTDNQGRGKIIGIMTPVGLIKADQFIDCSYEGDLMAAALGPSGYTWGRESSSTYGEATAGFRGYTNVSPDTAGVYPLVGTDFRYYTGGGTLAAAGYPFVAIGTTQTRGDADDKVQSYNFRLPLTRSASNRLPWIKPDGYDFSQYVTYMQILRNLGKTTFCRSSASSSFGWQGNGVDAKVNFNDLDLLNGNIGYPDGNWSKRQKICVNHVTWQQGFLWALANDSRTRDYGLGPLQDDMNDTAGGGAAAIGLCADEFQSSPWGAGWPYWLYCREARRLKGMTVMTFADTQPSGRGGTPTKPNSIGLWAYYPDIHGVQGLLAAGSTGTVIIEGSGNAHTATATYQIPLSAILPQVPTSTNPSCINLSVPVCSSFSHEAWAPQRLEIAFGICGEAAGELAAWLCDNPTKATHDYNYADLAARLTAFGSKL